MEAKENTAEQSKLAAVRIRTSAKIKKKISDTLNMLNLYKKNYCVVWASSPSVIGMLRKTKDYITWGTIDKDTFELLVEKRGEEYLGRGADRQGKIEYKNYRLINGKKYKPFFRLSPPRKGFERKGIKVPFKTGGALGDRKANINDLLRRMI